MRLLSFNLPKCLVLLPIPYLFGRLSRKKSFGRPSWTRWPWTFVRLCRNNAIQILDKGRTGRTSRSSAATFGSTSCASSTPCCQQRLARPLHECVLMKSCTEIEIPVVVFGSAARRSARIRSEAEDHTHAFVFICELGSKGRARTRACLLP